jgi:hypothetical protein
MKKIISFSLYGAQPKYLIGMLCNAELAKIIYPGWIVRVYHGESVPIEYIQKLSCYDNVELVKMEENSKYQYMMWRFLPISEDDVEIMLSRDADSRLSYREKKLVEIFESSDYLFHSIRDNVSHFDIMGGMWGMKKNNRINMRNLVESWDGHLGYDSDQSFLRQIIKPYFEDSCLTHCSSFLNNFPFPRDPNGYFIGGWWHEDNFGKPYDYVFF